MLITGGSGLLALNWAQSQKDHFEITLGLNKRQVNLDGVSMLNINTSSYDSLLADIELLNPAIIIHTAGLTSVEGCEQNKELAYAVNVELAANVARIAEKLQCRLVHISTDHLYDGTKPYMEETAVPSPVNVYGQTKYIAEKKVAEANPAALIIRTNFFSWGPGYRSSFSDTILHALRSGNEISLFSDVYFTPILIQSLVITVHELIDKEVSGIFNVVGDKRVSKYEFGLLLSKQFNLDQTLIRPIYFKNKIGLTKRPLDLSLSNRKTYTTLGRELGDVSAHLKILYDLEDNQDILQIQQL